MLHTNAPMKIAVNREGALISVPPAMACMMRILPVAVRHSDMTYVHKDPARYRNQWQLGELKGSRISSLPLILSLGLSAGAFLGPRVQRRSDTGRLFGWPARGFSVERSS